METKKEEGHTYTVNLVRGIPRYIDDLFVLNGRNVIDDFKQEIYGDLSVNKENDVSYMTHFLDVRFVINDGKLIVSTYDKRDAFPFAVRNFPDLSGNVHVRRSHGVIVGQLLRYRVYVKHSAVLLPYLLLPCFCTRYFLSSAKIVQYSSSLFFSNPCSGSCVVRD